MQFNNPTSIKNENKKYDNSTIKKIILQRSPSSACCRYYPQLIRLRTRSVSHLGDRRGLLRRLCSRRPEQPLPRFKVTVDAFRTALGDPNNGNNPGPLASGRREINWDGGGNNFTTSPR